MCVCESMMQPAYLFMNYVCLLKKKVSSFKLIKTNRIQKKTHFRSNLEV